MLVDLDIVALYWYGQEEATSTVLSGVQSVEDAEKRTYTIDGLFFT